MTAPTASSRKTVARRRQQLMQAAGDGSILILPAAPERIRSRDTHYPYRQDSDFWYLTGCAEPDAVLVLVPGRKHGEAILFCRERDPEREGWDGPRLGPDGAVELLGMDDAYPISDIDDILPGLLEGRRRVHYHLGRDADFDLTLIGWLNRVRAQARQGAQPPQEFLELGHLLDEMRLFKSADEVKLMQRAADISVEAHRAAMRAARAGIHEYELQAELERVFRMHDAQPAYASIVGAGANGCVLHYRDNNAKSRDGELVLIDAGAEYRGYAADITRTYSADAGDEFQAMVDAVDVAQLAMCDAVRAGFDYKQLHLDAHLALAGILKDFGVIKVGAEEALANGVSSAFFPHGIGHGIGLQVHDVAGFAASDSGGTISKPEGHPYLRLTRVLEPGMVVTIEPGIYFIDMLLEELKQKGLADAVDWARVDAFKPYGGIRIEDDVACTDGAPLNLTREAFAG